MGVKISALDVVTSPASSDLVVIVRTDSWTKKCTLANFFTALDDDGSIQITAEMFSPAIGGQNFDYDVAGFIYPHPSADWNGFLSS